VGTFSVTVTIAATTNGHKKRRIKALVDTGATLMSVPAPVLKSMGVKPTFHRWVELADGSVRSCEGGNVMLTLAGETQPIPVLFAEPKADACLGAVPLEAFSLGVDPVHRKLVPVVLPQKTRRIYRVR
jgi:predicted aspartyl protease